jgi:hypothetical protein
MKRALLMAVVLLAGAAGAEEFRSQAPIKLEGKDPFQRVELPFEVYRDARRDLGDVRVLNARGEAAPLALAGEAEPEKVAPVSTVLPQFPVNARTAPTTTASGGRIDVQVRARGDGTLVSVQERPAGKVPGAPRPVAYLLDASQVKTPIALLRFDWDASAGSEIVKVNVEASDDLRDWRSLASRSALVRLEQGGLALSQNQVNLGAASAKYFRITWDGGVFTLRSVQAESAPTVKPVERRVLKVANAQRTKEGDLVFDLGARLPVEAIRVLFPEPNSVAPFEIAVRDNREAPWRTLASATFYRIVRDGIEIASPPLELRSRASMREWRLRPQVKGGGSDSQLPSIEVLWRPAEVVFVAKGDAPFTLAFGDAEARSVAIPISSLMPGYERYAERKLAPASVGAVQTMTDVSPVRSVLGDIPPRKAALWAVLIIGVLVLGFMAWRLQGQMKGK